MGQSRGTRAILALSLLLLAAGVVIYACAGCSLMHDPALPLGGSKPNIPKADGSDLTLWALNAVGGLSILGLFACIVGGITGIWKAPKLAGALLITALSAWFLRLLMAKYAALLVTLGLVGLLAFAGLFIWGHRKWIERKTGVDLTRDGLAPGVTTGTTNHGGGHLGPTPEVKAS